MVKEEMYKKDVYGVIMTVEETQYVTTDGKRFLDREKAEAHQLEIDEKIEFESAMRNLKYIHVENAVTGDDEEWFYAGTEENLATIKKMLGWPESPGVRYGLNGAFRFPGEIEVGQWVTRRFEYGIGDEDSLPHFMTLDWMTAKAAVYFKALGYKLEPIKTGETSHDDPGVILGA